MAFEGLSEKLYQQGPLAHIAFQVARQLCAVCGFTGALETRRMSERP